MFDANILSVMMKSESIKIITRNIKIPTIFSSFVIFEHYKVINVAIKLRLKYHYHYQSKSTTLPTMQVL